MTRVFLLAFSILVVSLSFLPLLLATQSPEPATAQSEVDPVLTVTLYGSKIRYSTVPRAPVLAELSDADGVVKATGFAAADEMGSSTIIFDHGIGLYHNDPSDGILSWILPGDSLSLTRTGAEPRTFIVPEFGAEIDVEGSRVVGIAPPSSMVDLNLTSSGMSSSFSATAVADAGGSFSIDLGGSPAFDLGNADGTVATTTPDGLRVLAVVAALRAEIVLGTNRVRGWATPGTAIEITIEREGEIPVSLTSREELLRTEWSIGHHAGRFVFQEGDKVRVGRSGGLVEIPHHVEATLAAVTIHLDPGADVVSGSASPGAALRMSATSIEGRIVTMEGVAGPDGAYTFDVGEVFDLTSGWSVAVRSATSPGFATVASESITHVRLPVRTLVGHMVKGGGSHITVTLRSPSGEFKAETWTSGGPTEVFTFSLHGDIWNYTTWTFTKDPIQLSEPGDMVEVTLVAGDPHHLRVPDLSAWADVETDAISGRADPGAEVRVDVETRSGESAWTTAVADAEGVYSASFAGVLDVGPRSKGTVSVSAGSAISFYTAWAANPLMINMDGPDGGISVLGRGVYARIVTAKLFDAAGRELAAASEPYHGDYRVTRFFDEDIVNVGLGGPGFPFLLEPADTFGQPVTPEAGDTLRVTIGDEVIDLDIPSIDASTLIGDDTIIGRTSADSTVTAWFSRYPPSIDHIATTTSDSDGNFVLAVGDAFDIRSGDHIEVGVTQHGHVFWKSIDPPGLELDVDSSELRGWTQPTAQVRVTLTRAGEPLFSAVSTSDDTGAFATIFLDARSTPITPLPGDSIRAAPLDEDLDAFELVVPTLEIVQDIEADTVGGRADPGGSLALLATESFLREHSYEAAQAWPLIREDGTWDAAFVPAIDVRPGTRISAIYRTGDGHRVILTDTEPIFNVEHSGAYVCGFGRKRSALALELRDADGALRGSTRTTTRFDGFFSAVLRDDEGTGAPVAITATNIISGDLGSSTRSMTVERFDAIPTWVTSDGSPTPISEGGYFRGPVAPDRNYVLFQAVPCADQQPPGEQNLNNHPHYPHPVGPDGILGAYTPWFWSVPGSGTEIGAYTAEGHRLYRHYYRPLAKIHVLADRVTGQVDPLSDIVLHLKSGEGVEKATVAVRSDENGAFDARLVDDAGDPVASRAGDVVTMDVVGEASEIPVESLVFDWTDGADSIFGSAPAGRYVSLSLRLDSGDTIDKELLTDADGRWSFSSLEIPPRATWSMDDMIGVRASMQTPNRHWIISQTDGYVPRDPEPTPSPTPTPSPSPSPSPTPSLSPSPVPTSGSDEVRSAIFLPSLSADR